MTAPVQDKFWSNVNRKDASDCWEWLGSRNEAGYGIFLGNIASRFSYQLHWGIIPEGMLVCHECDNKACVNPMHLYCGTYSDNMRDKLSRSVLYRKLKNVKLEDLIEDAGGARGFARKMRVLPETVENWIANDGAIPNRSWFLFRRAGLELAD